MNIFYLDEDIKECAKAHVDRHIVKMILESAQMLSTAHWVNGGSAPYRKTHVNHPSTKWARENLCNYNYLCDLGLELCNQFELRYKKVHKTKEVLLWLKNNKPNIPEGDFYPPTPAMDNQYKKTTSLESYRNYYKYGKVHLHNWSVVDPPAWIQS
jgi:hypothetical protein